jgi:hypothetical protein
MILVNSIQFDFTTDDDFTLNEQEQYELEQQVLEKQYHCAEDEICDVISDETGWCINHIDYIVV